MKRMITRMLILTVLCGALCACEGQPLPSETELSTAAPTEALTETLTEAPTEAPTEPTCSLQMSAEEYPKIDCATAMYPMTVEIAKTVLNLSHEEADSIFVSGKTAKAYANLIDGTVDLLFASEPSDDILRQAEEAGVDFEMVGIGWDGFVFLLNQNNPVESLTLDEIRSIYTGDITNWSQVGGEDCDIMAFQREPNSGSQNLMEKMVMKGTAMAEVPKEWCISSMEGLIDQVASYESSRASIGYSIYLYAKEQYVSDNVKFLRINGIPASDETIADGSYPLTKVVYAIFRSDEEEGSPVRRLVDWLKTEEGQQCVIAGGYVGLK